MELTVNEDQIKKDVAKVHMLKGFAEAVSGLIVILFKLKVRC